MQTSEHPAPLPDRRIALVGAGRLGTALAHALRAAGAPVAGPFGRGQGVGDAEIVLLCVPDDAIGAAAAEIPAGRLVGHCSGASTLDVLAPHERFSVHPLIAVSGPEAPFAGAACAVSGSTPRALAVATGIARILEMRPLPVPDSARAIYHAAATMASNYLVTLEAAAERLAAQAGVGREHLVPLVRASVENWARTGPRPALTGPIVRGDEATVARQRAAVAAAVPDLVPLWDALVDATRRLAATPVADA